MGEGFRNTGYCHCCRAQVTFTVKGDWLRDDYVCSACGSIPRQRHLQMVLDRYFPDWGSLQVHESSPSNNYISKFCSDYSYSFYFSEAQVGQQVNGMRCENLERLTFGYDSFDLVITQDVFEHVFQPERAAREIMRVLKPGGAHVFTAPKHRGLRQSLQRASLEGGSVHHYVEAAYHGNPVGDGKALVTWDYGDDFEMLMHKWCGHPTTTYVTKDRDLGIDGEFIEVFVTRKALT